MDNSNDLELSRNTSLYFLKLIKHIVSNQFYTPEIGFNISKCHLYVIKAYNRFVFSQNFKTKSFKSFKSFKTKTKYQSNQFRPHSVNNNINKNINTQCVPSVSVSVSNTSTHSVLHTTDANNSKLDTFLHSDKSTQSANVKNIEEAQPLALNKFGDNNLQSVIDLDKKTSDSDSKFETKNNEVFIQPFINTEQKEKEKLPSVVQPLVVFNKIEIKPLTSQINPLSSIKEFKQKDISKDDKLEKPKEIDKDKIKEKENPEPDLDLKFTKEISDLKIHLEIDEQEVLLQYKKQLLLGKKKHRPKLLNTLTFYKSKKFKILILDDIGLISIKNNLLVRIDPFELKEEKYACIYQKGKTTYSHNLLSEFQKMLLNMALKHNS